MLPVCLPNLSATADQRLCIRALKSHSQLHSTRSSMSRASFQSRSGATARPDVFISHAGEDKSMAADLHHDLSNDGGLKLKAFMDRDSLKPGMAADKEMLNSIENSAVGLLLLTGSFVGKKLPMMELRLIVQQNKSLPVLYNTSYEQLEALLNEQGEADADVLQQLRRTTMVQHNTPKDPVLFRQQVCFAVLRHLATVCCPELDEPTAGNLRFVERIRDAVKHVCSDGNYEMLPGMMKKEARGWRERLNVQIDDMVEKQPHVFRANLNKWRKAKADDLEKEYRGSAISQDMALLQKWHYALGDRWPQALFPPAPASGSGDVWDILQRLHAFWERVQRMCEAHELLWPEDDPGLPEGFFNEEWSKRRSKYKCIVEPVTTSMDGFVASLDGMDTVVDPGFPEFLTKTGEASSIAAPAPPVSTSDWRMPPQPSSVIRRTSNNGRGNWEGLFGLPVGNPISSSITDAGLGQGNWEGLFGSPVGNTISTSITDAGLQQELVKYGYLVNVAVGYHIGKQYQTWEQHEIDPQPKSTLPMGNLPAIYINPEITGRAAKAARLYEVYDDPMFYLFSAGDLSFLGSSNMAMPTNFIGYVAISAPVGGKRDIAVVFRGTNTFPEWMADFDFHAVAWDTASQKPSVLIEDLNKPGCGIWVEEGLETLYRSAMATPGDYLSVQGQVQVAVRTLLARYGDEVASITTTGHSLGGALASMCAFDLAFSEINKVGAKPGGALVPVTAITFCATAVGNQAYADTFTSNQPILFNIDRVPYVNMIRVVNDDDIIPKVPPPPVYVQGGIRVGVNTEKWLQQNPEQRPGMNMIKQFKQYHNLDLTLWLLDHSYPINKAAQLPLP